MNPQRIGKLSLTIHGYEAICIGPDIVILPHRTEDGKWRVTILAPTQLRIRRTESDIDALHRLAQIGGLQDLSIALGTDGGKPVATCSAECSCAGGQHVGNLSQDQRAHQGPSATDSHPSGIAHTIPTTQVKRPPWDRNPRR